MDEILYFNQDKTLQVLIFPHELAELRLYTSFEGTLFSKSHTLTLQRGLTPIQGFLYFNQVSIVHTLGEILYLIKSYRLRLTWVDRYSDMTRFYATVNKFRALTNVHATDTGTHLYI